MIVTAHTFESATTWTLPSGMTEGFERNCSGQSIEANYLQQTAVCATGAKSATAFADPDDGNTHILALRPAAPVVTIGKRAGTMANDVMIASIGVRPSSASITAPAGWTLVRQKLPRELSETRRNEPV